MRKQVVSLGMVVVLFFCFVSVAYPWGYAGHAHIAAKLNKQLGQRNENEVYGAMGPDLFNFSFDLPVYTLGGPYYQLHYLFPQVWDQKKTGMEKGTGYGFISHNDLWGADFTAHHSSRTYGSQHGYVVAKAGELSAAAPLLASIVGEDAALELCHTFVEFGLEALTKRIDPQIGERICSAALERSPRFAEQLVQAYAEGFAPYFGGSPELAAPAIVLAEGEFRNEMLLYGQMLMMNEQDLLDTLAVYLAGFADDYRLLQEQANPGGSPRASEAKAQQASLRRLQEDYLTTLQRAVAIMTLQAQHGSVDLSRVLHAHVALAEARYDAAASPTARIQALTAQCTDVSNLLKGAQDRVAHGVGSQLDALEYRAAYLQAQIRLVQEQLGNAAKQ